jgi:hypothetical protein
VLEAAVRQAIEQKHPRLDREPERPQRPRSRVVTLPSPGGARPDLFVDGGAASQVRDPESKVTAPSRLPGYEPIGEDGSVMIHLQAALFALAVAVVAYVLIGGARYANYYP